MTTIYLATYNFHKLEEIKSMVPMSLNINSLKDISPQINWLESGQTFKENALIKLKAAQHVLSPQKIIAEDSGLVVPALGGAPGVLSKRYADGLGDQKNIEKLLDELGSFSQESRKAYFICTLAYFDGGASISVFEGRCYGSISLGPKGEKGFGYDPVFIPDGFTKTFAELGSVQKNKISHRKKAVEAWVRAV